VSDQILYLVEVVAAVDAAGSTETLRYGNRGYQTEPGDTPANVNYLPRISNAGTITREMFSGERTEGASRVGYGEIVLTNTDGGLDDLKDYGFDNRQLMVKTGTPETAFASLNTVLVATMAQVALSRRSVSISLKDRLYELDTQHQKSTYAGSNSLPNGLDGVADLQGKPKPYMLGKVYNVSPPLVNTSRLIYQLNNGAINSVEAVYDGGVALTAGATYPDQATMESTAPAAGQYRVWLAGGYFRLGSSPVFEITADATQGAAAGNRTTAQLLKQLALDAGIDSGDITAGDVTALDTANSAVVGIWFADERTTLAAMDEVAASVGAYYGFDRLGDLRMARFAAPSGTPVLTIDQNNGFDLDRVVNRDGQPTYRVTVNHSKFWTTQTSGLSGSVTAANRSNLAQEYRATATEDLDVLDQHLAAQEQVRNTLLTSASDAATEATRLLTLYKTRRDVYKVTVRLTSAAIQALDLNAVVTLQWDRFGLDAGQLFRVIAGEFDYSRNRAILTLWG
jgi:hypothetical protein